MWAIVMALLSLVATTQSRTAMREGHAQVVKDEE